MKTRTILKLLFVASLVFPAACAVKDPIFNTSHPGHGMVTLTTDWSGIGTGLTPPKSYTVAATLSGSDATAPEYTATLTGVTNKLDHLFAPGNYHFYVYNTPEHITISGTTATVAEGMTTPDGPSRFIQNTPGWLFFATADLDIKQDTEYTLTATMQQQVRQLTLIIAPTGSTTERIAHIEGYLTGVASKLDIASGTHSVPMNIPLEFSRITTGDNAGCWSATVRLLGIAGSEQMLVGGIHFTNDSPDPIFIEDDISSQLAAFNTDKRKPLTLSSRVVETPAEAGFGATITDWETVTGDGPVVAD